MSKKKSQISLFIALGVTLMVVVSILLYINAESKKQSLEDDLAGAPDDVKAVKAYIQGCFDKTAHDSLLYVAPRGGYYNLDSMFFMTNASVKIPFYYYEGKNNMPSVETVQEQISGYFYENIGRCLSEEFEEFNKRGLVVETSRPKIEIMINDEKVNFFFDINTIVTKEGSEFKFSYFDYESKLPLGRLLKTSNTLVNKIVEDPEVTDLTTIYGFDDTEVSVIGINSTTEVYILKEKNPFDDEGNLKEEYVFFFGVKYGKEVFWG